MLYKAIFGLHFLLCSPLLECYDTYGLFLHMLLCHSTLPKCTSKSMAYVMTWNPKSIQILSPLSCSHHAFLSQPWEKGAMSSWKAGMFSKAKSEKYKNVFASGLSCSLFYVSLEGPKASSTVTLAFGPLQFLMHNLIVTTLLECGP